MTTTEAVELVKQLAPICKTAGIKRIRVGDIEIEFGGGGIDEETIRRFQDVFSSGLPTEEDALNWSTPGYVPSTERQPEKPMPKTARGRGPG